MSISTWLRGMLEEGRYRNTIEMSFEWKIPDQTIRRYLSGERRPTVSQCIKLSEVTSTPLDEVVRMAAEDDDDARGPLRKAV